ncbi:hypothetical protein I3760_01G263800 [Carya illinoinensis]|nr:hypothetical protein I3760_01G263800 [Carya illinoinensis]
MPYLRSTSTKASLGTSQDAYVLCRVFHKNNIGPPNSHRYAPFIEEEWDDGIPAFLQGEEARIQVVADPDSHAKEASQDARIKEAGLDAFVEGNSHSAYVENYGECVENRQDSFVEGNNFEQDTRSINDAPLGSANEVPRDSQIASVDCKSERIDDCLSLCMADPRPPLIYKRRRHCESNSNHPNASETSTRISQDRCSSTTTTEATTLTMTTGTTMTTAAPRNFLSALVEYSLLESIDPKDSRSVSPPFDPANLGSSVPPSCLKFIQELQNELHKISVERETLKFETMSAQTMIRILQSRIEHLNKEKEDLRKSIGDAN